MSIGDSFGGQISHRNSKVGRPEIIYHQFLRIFEEACSPEILLRCHAMFCVETQMDQYYRSVLHTNVLQQSCIFLVESRLKLW